MGSIEAKQTIDFTDFDFSTIKWRNCPGCHGKGIQSPGTNYARICWRCHRMKKVPYLSSRKPSNLVAIEGSADDAYANDVFYTTKCLYVCLSREIVQDGKQWEMKVKELRPDNTGKEYTFRFEVTLNG